MARTKGSLNKQSVIPPEYTLSSDDRIQLIAQLLIEIISDELCSEN